MLPELVALLAYSWMSFSFLGILLAQQERTTEKKQEDRNIRSPTGHRMYRQKKDSKM